MILDAKVYSILKLILDECSSLRADVSFVARGNGRLRKAIATASNRCSGSHSCVKKSNLAMQFTTFLS